MRSLISKRLENTLASGLVVGTAFAASSDRDYEVQGELPAHIKPTLSPPCTPPTPLAGER